MSRPTRSARTRRRFAAAALAVVGVAGFGTASASQLGVSSALAAGSATVTSCQPGGQPIQVGFVSVFSGGGYQARDVVLRNIAATCAGKRLELTVQDGAGVALQQVTVASVTAGTMTIDITDRAASSIGGVAVVITG